MTAAIVQGCQPFLVGTPQCAEALVSNKTSSFVTSVHRAYRVGLQAVSLAILAGLTQSLAEAQRYSPKWQTLGRLSPVSVQAPFADIGSHQPESQGIRNQRLTSGGAVAIQSYVHATLLERIGAGIRNTVDIDQPVAGSR